MIHGPYADSTRRPLLPSLDHLFISNILEGKEGNQLIRARLIVFPFLRLSSINPQFLHPWNTSSPSFHSFHFEFSRLFSINWKNIPSLYPQNIIQKQERARLVSRREDCKRADTRWFRFGIQNARYAGTGRKPVVRLMRRLVDNSLQ